MADFIVVVNPCIIRRFFRGIITTRGSIEMLQAEGLDASCMWRKYFLRCSPSRALVTSVTVNPQDTEHIYVVRGRVAMRKDQRNLLEVLRSEFDFLKDGSYARMAKYLWRPRFLLEDSPSCPNYCSPKRHVPCNECVLMALVPPPLQEKKVPCRHIPLNSQGQTLDSLYRTADEAETEKVFRTWLCSTIETMQKNRLAPAKDSKTDVNYEAGQPLFRKLTPKCANSACNVLFAWRDGGKFFRFRSTLASENPCTKLQCGSGPHQVRHYWLCEDCSRLFTLLYKDGHGVVLEFRSPAADSQSSNPASEVTLPETAISIRDIS